MAAAPNQKTVMGIISYLDGILKDWHRAKGLRLVEEADDFVHLYQYGRRVATFTQHATMLEINQAADKFMEAA